MATALKSLRDQLIQNILKGSRNATMESATVSSEGAPSVGTAPVSSQREMEQEEIDELLDEAARPGTQVEQENVAE